jgi:hypothetical protein
VKADALHQLTNIKQGSQPIEAHNAKFMLLVSESGLGEEHGAILTDYYQRSLNTDILKAVWQLRP